MSKYLFYAAFLYLCYYAGIKAYPPTINPATTEVRKEMNADRSKMQSATTAKGLLKVQPGPQEHPVSSVIKQEINKAITGSHILIIALPVAANISHAQDSIIRQAATRSLALLNEVNK